MTNFKLLACFVGGVFWVRADFLPTAFICWHLLVFKRGFEAIKYRLLPFKRKGTLQKKEAALPLFLKCEHSVTRCLYQKTQH